MGMWLCYNYIVSDAWDIVLHWVSRTVELLSYISLLNYDEKFDMQCSAPLIITDIYAYMHTVRGSWFTVSREVRFWFKPIK